MTTIHQEIDDWLAADLYGELSDMDREVFHSHLVECEECRHLHQKNKIMDKVLNETLSKQKPGPQFEQRMLAGFRNRIPLRHGGPGNFLTNLIRLRSTRIVAAAAVLLVLAQLGRMITQTGASPRRWSYLPAGGSEADPSRMLGQTFYDLQNDPNAKQSDVGRLAKGREAMPMAPAVPSTKSKQVAIGGIAGADTSAIESAASISENRIHPSFAQEATPAPSLELHRDLVTKAFSIDAPVSEMANRKLIRNATVDLEVGGFEDIAQKISALAKQARGYVATTSSEKQANGKLKGEIVVKVVPENLDAFLQNVRGLGELKNQTLGTEDITKSYFDTDARLKNARVMEQRLIDILKKKSDDINDLLQVEKELGRVREEIEKMQGELKFWDTQVQFATVTITLAEKDLEEPAAFLMKERAQLALYAPEVEQVYNNIKNLASAKVQITNAQLDRDNTGRISARVNMLIAPEESETVIGKVKAMGRVENFQVQTERVAQNGTGMSENAKTRRDKVELNISISRDEQEPSLQQTSLRIRTSTVDEKTKALRDLTEKQGGRIRSSTFSRDPNGREVANVTVRVPMKTYNALMQSLDSLGKVEDVSVQRQDRSDGAIDLANAPADLTIEVYSQGNIVSQENTLFSTIRQTLTQSVSAIMWSLRMIGVAVAFLAPWVIAVVLIGWTWKRIKRSRPGRSE